MSLKVNAYSCINRNNLSGSYLVMMSSCCPGMAKLPVCRGVDGTAMAPDPKTEMRKLAVSWVTPR
jgi:hypothetical protein